MAGKKKRKPTVKKPPTKKQAVNLAESQLLAKFGETIKSSEKIIAESNKEEQVSDDNPRKTSEDNYPGVTKQIRQFEEKELPTCTHCKSDDTATVRAGVIGRSITIAASTRKLKLVLNKTAEMGTYFCNNCKKYFD